MDIGGVVNIIAATVAIATAMYALRAKRGELNSRLLDDLRKSYEQKCQECEEAWEQVDKAAGKIIVLESQVARLEAENAKQRERFERRRLDAANGNP
jgi:predicted nuclease with TOPRIM domain